MDEELYDVQLRIENLILSGVTRSSASQAADVMDIFLTSNLAANEVQQWYAAQQAVDQQNEN